MERIHSVIRTDMGFREKSDVGNVVVCSNAGFIINRVEIMWLGAVPGILKTKMPVP